MRTAGVKRKTFLIIVFFKKEKNPVSNFTNMTGFSPAELLSYMKFEGFSKKCFKSMINEEEISQNKTDVLSIKMRF